MGGKGIASLMQGIPYWLKFKVHPIEDNSFCCLEKRCNYMYRTVYERNLRRTYVQWVAAWI